MIRNYNIFNENCITGMRKIASGSVDLILTDLPYGITSAYFDKRVPFAPMWEQFLRVTKLNAAIVLFSQMPFGAELIMSQPKLFRYEWIWEKDSGAGFLNAKKMPLRVHENILVFYRSLPKYNPQFFKSFPYVRWQRKDRAGINYRKPVEDTVTINKDGRRYPRDVMKFNIPRCSGEKVGHPQQKPVDLLEYLIKTYTDAGETVLDATMGSGSTGVAAINTGRKFIGFESEEQYFNIAEKRIKEALAAKQQELFNFDREEELECGNCQED